MDVIKIIKDNVEIIKLTAIIIGGSFALWQYYIQNVFNRAKNLDELWKKYFENKEFVELFTKMDRIYNETNNDEQVITDLQVELRNLPREIKLKILACLSELLIFYRSNTIDKNKVIQLYQWHFYYIYLNKNTYVHFWYNLISNENGAVLNDDEITIRNRVDHEIAQYYWSGQYKLALKCRKEIESRRKRTHSVSL